MARIRFNGYVRYSQSAQLQEQIRVAHLKKKLRAIQMANLKTNYDLGKSVLVNSAHIFKNGFQKVQNAANKHIHVKDYLRRYKSHSSMGEERRNMEGSIYR